MSLQTRFGITKLFIDNNLRLTKSYFMILHSESLTLKFRFTSDTNLQYLIKLTLFLYLEKPF